MTGRLKPEYREDYWAKALEVAAERERRSNDTASQSQARAREMETQAHQAQQIQETLARYFASKEGAVGQQLLQIAKEDFLIATIMVMTGRGINPVSIRLSGEGFSRDQVALTLEEASIALVEAGLTAKSIVESIRRGIDEVAIGIRKGTR